MSHVRNTKGQFVEKPRFGYGPAALTVFVLLGCTAAIIASLAHQDKVYAYDESMFHSQPASVRQIDTDVRSEGIAIKGYDVAGLDTPKHITTAQQKEVTIDAWNKSMQVN